MTNEEKSFRFYSIFAISASILLVTLAILNFTLWNYDFKFPGENVLSGKIILTTAEFQVFTNKLYALYTIDTIFIILWIGSIYFGIFRLFFLRSKIQSIIFLVLGISGGLFDFAENGFVTSVLKSINCGYELNSSWIPRWHFVNDMSYLLSYTSIFFLLPLIWQLKLPGKIMTIFFIILTILAVSGIYFENLYIFSYIWFLFWAATSFVMLLKSAKIKIILNSI